MNFQIRAYFLTLLLAFFLFGTMIQSSAASEGVADPETILTFFPIYPREQLLSQTEGKVSLMIKVGREGRVEKVMLEEASHKDFAESAAAAVREWRFKPYPQEVMEGYQVRQTFRFQPTEDSFFSFKALSMHPDLKRRVIPIVGIRPEYPDELTGNLVRGYADVIITVSATGLVIHAEIEDVSHQAFKRNALLAARQWRFRPVNPETLYYQNTGKQPPFLSPEISNARCRLTLVFSPEPASQAPLDLRQVGY